LVLKFFAIVNFVVNIKAGLSMLAALTEGNSDEGIAVKKFECIK
jgi:hypothetical protein